MVAHSAKSLGMLKVREATTPLSEQMNSKAVIVRRAATKALVSIGATLKQRKPLRHYLVIVFSTAMAKSA